ncbi:MAG: Fic family protein [Phycisphaerales bacterium]|nr:Fic family protein [Phycisphaerales bacterium]
MPLQQEARIKIERLDGRVRALGGNAGLLIRPLQRREALTSNRIEGTFVTAEELLQAEAVNPDGDISGAGDPQMGGIGESIAYGMALKRGQELIDAKRDLDRETIKELHSELLSQSSRGREKKPGLFRSIQVAVGHDRRYVPPPPEELDRLLANLEAYHLAPTDQLDPLLRVFVAHYQFEAIHPFEDGNGRLGRLLLALSAYKWLGLLTPCLYLSEYFDRHREEYIRLLFRVSTHGEWAEWLAFCLQGAIEQAENSIRMCDALESLRREYKAAVPSRGRCAALIDDLFVRPVITVADVMRKFNVTYKTAKADLEKIKELGFLRDLPDVYPRTLAAARILSIAYRTDGGTTFHA